MHLRKDEHDGFSHSMLNHFAAGLIALAKETLISINILLTSTVSSFKQ